MLRFIDVLCCGSPRPLNESTAGVCAHKGKRVRDGDEPNVLDRALAGCEKDVATELLFDTSLGCGFWSFSCTVTSDGDGFVSARVFSHSKFVALYVPASLLENSVPSMLCPTFVDWLGRRLLN